MEPWRETTEDLKEELYKAPTLGHPNYKFSFFLFMHENKENALGVPTRKHRDHQRPIGYCSQQLDSVAKGLLPCRKATSAIGMCKQTEEIVEIVMSSPLTIYASHSAESLLNSHQTALLGQLTSCYEVLLLSAHNFTLVWCNSLNPATLLSSL